jgi:hypothetical protein
MLNQRFSDPAPPERTSSQFQQEFAPQPNMPIYAPKATFNNTPEKALRKVIFTPNVVEPVPVKPKFAYGLTKEKYEQRTDAYGRDPRYEGYEQVQQNYV